jgi:tRNA threonylcarbamoyladenosine biosynthesis protein TsaE
MARISLLTASASETRLVGRAVSSLLRPGDVVSLGGDLGAGKTTLVQGIAAGLGVEDPILSPTFTLVRQYRGRFPVYHLDVYRLERVQDVLDLGVDEMVEEGAIVAVEWGDAVGSLLPQGHLQVELGMDQPEAAAGEGEGELRRLVLSSDGPSWQERWSQLTELTGPWRSEG